MRNKLIAFFLPLVITAKAFAAPADSACGWVDNEVLAALGLDNAVPQMALQGTDNPKVNQCTFTALDAPLHSLMITIQPIAADFALKPNCDWQALQFPGAEVEMELVT